MAPRPYSDRAPLPDDSESVTSVPPQILGESPSPPTLSGATTPSPIPLEIVATEPLLDVVDVQDERAVDPTDNVPCYPTPDDIMPYDHSLPDFIRQITNQSNLANLQKLSLRVISTLISLHRMASYLPNLRELDLEGSVLNSLRDIGCNLKNLQILKVGRCQLESLDGTFGLTSLRELYAQKNYINDVSPCSNLPHIRHIDVSGNRIRNISYAGFLSVCSKLKSIVFTGNPATEVSDYRKHVRRILPQIETLDGLPFSNEEIGEEFKEVEATDYLSDSSAEVPDFLSISPSESMTNFLDFEDDSFSVDKKSKQAKNVLHQLDINDCEVQETLIEPSPQNNLQDEFKNFNLQPNKAEINENKNLNVKKKFGSIQKIDKDLENRSKKSNFSLTGNLNEDLVFVSSVASSSASEEQTSPTSSSESISQRNNSKVENATSKKTNQTVRPSTSNGISRETITEESTPSGGVKKRPSTASQKPVSVENECGGKLELTTGTPVCGNLTAALRNRKKIQNSWNEKEQSKIKSILLPNSGAECCNKELLIQLNGSGDSGDVQCLTENEDDFIEEDVLLSSQKWREEFRRFRSNNRAVWEEEDQMDYSHFLGESLKEDLKEEMVDSSNKKN